MTRPFTLYLIRNSRRGRSLFFVPTDELEIWEMESDDHVHKGIVWLKGRGNRVVAWFGRLFESARGYHSKLEGRLDPTERVLRAMAGANRFVIHHGTSRSAGDVAGEFRSMLRRQRLKHRVWLVVDLVIAIAAAIFLTLIPGPNVVLLYFILRIFSHYRALQGIRAGVASDGAEFKPTAALDDLENALQSRSPDRVAVCAAADALNIPGLTPFIERML